MNLEARKIEFIKEFFKKSERRGYWAAWKNITEGEASRRGSFQPSRTNAEASCCLKPL